MSTQRKLYCAPSGGSSTLVRIDSGKILSQINHRLYRQGRNYCLRVGVDPNSAGTYDVYALRDDWMVHNAWKLAFQEFMNNSKEELERLSKTGGKARWQDFRVQHGISGAGVGDMQPVEYTITSATPTQGAFTAGEFVDSEVRTEAGASRTFSWGASAASVFSILEEYDKRGNTTTNPTTPLTSSAYSGLDDDNQDGQLGHISDDGNNPPYNSTSVSPSTPWIKVATLGAGAAGQQTLSSGYFNAPCGLVVIVRTTGGVVPTAAEVFCEYKSGTYKGVHALSMGTAKLVKNHYEVK